MQLQRPEIHICLNRMSRVIIYSGIELLLFFPIVLLTHLYLSPVSILTWIVLMGASYWIGALIAMTRIRRAIWFYIILLVTSAMLVGLMTAGSIGWKSIVIWGLSCYLVYRGAQMILHEWRTIFPSPAFFIGLICYFIMSVGAALSSAWGPYILTLLWTGIASLIVTLFAFNQHHLAAVTPKGFKTSGTVALRNRLWTLLLSGGILFISFVYVWKQAFAAILQAIGWIVQLIVSWLSGTPLPKEQTETMVMEEFSRPEIQDSLWRTIINILFNVIFFGILLLFVGWLCYRYFPLIRPAVKRLIQFIQRFISRENRIISNTGYKDEKKQLMQWEDIRSSLGQTLKNKWSKWLKREPKWADLNNWRDRVRWLYKHNLMQAISHGYFYRKDLTPRETIDDISQQGNYNGQEDDRMISLANYYDKARYGGQAEIIGDEQVDKLKELTIKDKN